MKSPDRRLIEPELLDHAPAEEAAQSLGDLRRINRFLGGYAILRRTLSRRYNAGSRFSLLDVGAGSGDMSRCVAESFRRSTVTALDYRLNHLQEGSGRRVAGDAFALPFADRSFDVVFCSLFLHHFTDAEVVKLLLEFGRAARDYVCVIDLQRQGIAFQFIPLTRWIAGWHPITVHDAQASVQAAFTAAELRGLAVTAGLGRIEMATHFPWARLSLLASPR